MASPCFSKMPASKSAIPSAQMEKSYWCLKNFKNEAIFFEKIRPSALKPSQIPKALSAMSSIAVKLIDPPPDPFITATIPRTTASMMMPSTSSKTAAASMVTPSGESIFFWSESIRAVMPTEVAVESIPRKRQRGSMNGASRRSIPTPAPLAKENTTPPRPTRPPTTE